MHDQPTKPEVANASRQPAAGCCTEAPAWQKGPPCEGVGIYDVTLDDGAEAMVDWHPWFEGELVHESRIVDSSEIVRHRKIPGETYGSAGASV